MEPAVFSAGEEDEALSFPTEDDGDGQDASLSVGPGWPWRDTSPWVTRRESLESLGVRISRLSQISAGKPRGDPCLAPSEEDMGHPRRPPGSSASRNGAGTGGHPRRKPTETRHQQPAATWGWQEGDAALAVEKEGGGSKQRGAHCSSHRESGLAPGYRGWKRSGGPGPSRAQGVWGAHAGDALAGTSPHLLMGFVVSPQNAVWSRRYRGSSGTLRQMQPPLQGAELRVLPCPAPGAAREAGSRPVPQGTHGHSGVVGVAAAMWGGHGWDVPVPESHAGPGSRDLVGGHRKGRRGDIYQRNE